MESLEKVRKMLERFYQGESTLEEEKWLGDYFSSKTVPEEFLPDKELFQAFSSDSGSIPVPPDLNRKILEKIEKEEQKELKTRRISLYSLSGLAAGLLVMIAVYLFFLRTDDRTYLASHSITDTYEDPLQAYREAKKAMAFVSSKFNQGTDQLKHVQEMSQKTTDPLQSLSMINRGSRELNLLGELKRVREVNQ